MTLTQSPLVTVDIYIAQHCENCTYAYEIIDEIRQHFPEVRVRLIDMQNTDEIIPETVFAVPTYLLNGKVWSLGNPSRVQVHEALGPLFAEQFPTRDERAMVNRK